MRYCNIDLLVVPIIENSQSVRERDKYECILPRNSNERASCQVGETPSWPRSTIPGKFYHKHATCKPPQLCSQCAFLQCPSPAELFSGCGEVGTPCGSQINDPIFPFWHRLLEDTNSFVRVGEWMGQNFKIEIPAHIIFEWSHTTLNSTMSVSRTYHSTGDSRSCTDVPRS